MRISRIASGRIKHHKNESVLSVLAITLTVLASMVAFTALDLLNESIRHYYQPLAGYNMVLERHGTMVQFFPVDSEFNDSIVPEIEKDLSVVVHPASFKIVEETIQAVIPNTLVGVTIPFLAKLLEQEPYSGRMPVLGVNEVIVGNSVQFVSNDPVIGENLTIFDKNFTIVGKVVPNNPIMANFIFTTYEAMQDALGLNGTCNVLFLEKGVQADEAWLEAEIETRYPTLKFVTGEEMDVLSSDVMFNASSWNGFLVAFTLFICISFPLTSFFINHDKNFKEARLLRLIGTPRSTILLVKSQEHVMVFALGAALGSALALFVYPFFTLAATAMQGITYDALGLYEHTFNDVLPNAWNGFLSLAGALLAIGPVVLLLPYAATIWRVERAFSTRDKKGK